jgi:hypothetical protein
MSRQIFFTDAECVPRQGYANGYWHEIEYQGQYLHWRVLAPDEPEMVGGVRGECHTFSRAAKMRMLATMARVAWREVGKTLFVTLTFPNEWVDVQTRKISQYLHVFRRGVEKYLQRKIAILWRLEWVERKSGDRKNYIFPHFHLLLFGARYIPYVVTNRIWKKALGYKKYCRTETTAMRSYAGAIFYVAKYAAKRNGSLVYAAYLNNKPTGRQWGILRKELIPFDAKFKALFPEDMCIASAYAYARQLLPRELLKANKSFRLFGINAEEIGKLIHGITVDGEIVDV